MKISREWLQTFFSSEGGPASGGDKPLPEAQTLADALTLHAFEVESVEGDVLDVKVTPNRGHDCLSHRGIAKELSAILNLPLKKDPLRNPVELKPSTGAVSICIENPVLCQRYIAVYIKGVKVGPSPDWLKNRLQSIGQKSINNVVDATNYVMFDLGQPLHAFDASKLEIRSSKLSIAVRNAKEGEKIATLDDKEYELAETDLVIADGNNGAAIGIAGVKGGKASGIDPSTVLGAGEKTANIILESANFNGIFVRRTAAALKLRTDASDRFQQVISPELAAYGARAAADLVLQLTGGELVGYADEYPESEQGRIVSASIAHINRVLGTSLAKKNIADVFKRLGFSYEEREGLFSVSIPFERIDITIPEDLVEEVGRIIDYDAVPSVELPLDPARGKPAVHAGFYAAEKVREDLMQDGYSEVYTSVFAEKGERAVANKIGGEKPYLRTSLIPSIKDALEKNIRNRDILDIPVPEVRIFEIGTVWRAGKEEMFVGVASESAGVSERPLAEIASDKPQGIGYKNLPVSAAEQYRPFSRYPFIVRDIAMWTPAGTKESEVVSLVRKEAGELLVHATLFDRFEKEDRTSLAFRLVFQSFDKTLTDSEANSFMDKVSSALTAKGFEIR